MKCQLPSAESPRLILVVEGANDIEFFDRLSARLQIDLPSLAALGSARDSGRIVVLPAGGGSPLDWSQRLASFKLPQLHLYDREQQPLTALRQQAIDWLNASEHCRARLLGKRTVENYLHPAAIIAAGGPIVSFGDQDCVGLLVAQQRFVTANRTASWTCLPPRAQKRLIFSSKRWLNRIATQHMTLALLAERDPGGELLEFLLLITAMIRC